MVRRYERRGAGPVRPGVRAPGRRGLSREGRRGGLIPPGPTAWIAIVLILAALPAQVLGSVEKAEGGIKFTYHDPEAGEVFLAGDFNGWSTSATPMSKLESGDWVATVQLGPGKHEYKFVVDGAWITDFDNPDSKPDPYGGVNSIVEVDNKGNVLHRAEGQKLANTPFNPRVNFGGFFLFRALTVKDYDQDTRWRMHRPQNAFDLNSVVTINEQVEGYARLRVDSETNLLQVNNVSAWLNEAYINVTPPGVFDLKGYYNMEVLRSEDPYTYFGDLDLAGTIFDDHLEAGKGTAGLTFETEQLGIRWTGFAANVHDYDIYNDPNLYDNTGTDEIHARAAKDYKILTAGVDFFMERNLWWLDMTSRVGTTPANTGIPRLDEHIDRTGDPSDWYEFEGQRWYAGADLTLRLLDEKLVPAIEYLRGRGTQGFVTSNNSGLDFNNGPIDVPILERDASIYHGEAAWTGTEHLYANVEHTRHELTGVGSDESLLSPTFLPDDEANKQIYFTVDADPPEETQDYSELELRWTEGSFDARLWFERLKRTWDRSDADLSEWDYVFSISPGISFTLAGWFDVEIESRYASFEGSESRTRDGSSIEAITRLRWRFASRFGALADVRTIRYDLDEQPGDEAVAKTFVAPFVGLEYRLFERASVVLAYGIDPLDFTIDYNGRQVGRWDFRNQYAWENPDTDILDAEQALQDSRVITLRAVFRF